MALARLASSNLLRIMCAEPKQSYWGTSLRRHFSPTAASSSSSGEDAAALSHDQHGDHHDKKKKSKLVPRRRTRRYGSSLWRNRDDHLLPAALWGGFIRVRGVDLFPASGLGNALVQASENINRLLEQLGGSTVGQVREKEDHYKLRLELPGLAKEDLKITVEDGVLHIRGEHKEEREEESDDEEHEYYWSRTTSSSRYGTSLMLPEDAKPDEIKAEMKDGV